MKNRKRPSEPRVLWHRMLRLAQASLVPDAGLYYDANERRPVGVELRQVSSNGVKMDYLTMNLQEMIWTQPLSLFKRRPPEIWPRSEAARCRPWSELELGAWRPGGSPSGVWNAWAWAGRYLRRMP